MAYQAFPRSKELLAGTSNYRVRFEFIGADEASEPAFIKELTITPDMTIQQGQEWVYQQINNAKPKKSVADLITIGTPVPPRAPAGPAAPTADDVWQANARRLVVFDALVKAGMSVQQANTDLAALKATVESGYTTARGAQL